MWSMTGMGRKVVMLLLAAGLLLKPLPAQADSTNTETNATSALIQQLGDASTRENAKATLVKIGSPAVDALIAASQDTRPDVRKAAAMALTQIKDPRTVELLVDELRDNDAYVRLTAIQALGMIGSPAVEPVLAVLKDWRPPVRRSAAIALGQIKDARAVDALVATMDDDDALVRAAAATALGAIGDARATKGLIAALNDKDSDVGIAVLGALSEMKDASAAEALIGLWNLYGWSSRQETLIAALVKIGSPAVDPLIAASKNRDKYAIEALGKIGDARAIPTLIANVKAAGYPEVQAAAAQALRSFKDPKAKNALAAYDAHEAKIAAVAAQYRSYIRKGKAGSEGALIEALNKYGDIGMATDYLNCGNAALEYAARQWATEHGYSVTGGGGGDHPRWGSKR